MPSGYAHYRFGTALLPELPGDVRRTVQRFRSLYDMGLHGPDIFFYRSPLLKTHAGFLGIKFHEQTGRSFFTRVCRMTRMEKSEAGLAYLYGVLCHYCLDSVMHPFVLEQAAEGPATHVQIETEFDRFLLETDGKVPPCAKDISGHMALTAGECETVARFYPPANARNIRDSVRAMALFHKAVAVPPGSRRKLLEAGMSLMGKELKGMLMTGSPNPLCRELNEGLLERYCMAEERLPEMLSQLQAHLAYSAPLESDFEAPFGGAAVEKEKAK